jgi:hypothetical protein
MTVRYSSTSRSVSITRPATSVSALLKKSSRSRKWLVSTRSDASGKKHVVARGNARRRGERRRSWRLERARMTQQQWARMRSRQPPQPPAGGSAQ